MSHIEITYDQTVTTDNFFQKAESGAVKFYRVRGNGTTRRIPYLGTSESQVRQEAEWVLEQREEGRSMKAIAAELHQSVPTVRRTINALLLAEEVEDFDRDELEELLSEATNEGQAAEAPKPTDENAVDPSTTNVEAEKPTDENPVDGLHSEHEEGTA